MTKKVDPIPKGYHSVTPYLVVENGCAKAIELYKKVFRAEEVMRMPGPDGKIGHAEIRIGNSIVMLSDGAPPQFPSTSAMNMVYVDDCDEAFKRAVENGATVIQPIENKFYGDRSGTIRDPHGQTWSISTHIEDVPPDEMEKRARDAAAKMG
jgi:PhnB protein